MAVVAGTVVATRVVLGVVGIRAAVVGAVAVAAVTAGAGIANPAFTLPVSGSWCRPKRYDRTTSVI